MYFHYYSFHKWQLAILADVFFHDHELKITNGIIAGQALIAADDIYFFIGHQILYYFSEHQVDPRLYTKSQSEINPDYIIGDNMIHFILTRVWIIKGIYMHKPINIGPLWFFIKYRINNFVFNFFIIIGTCQIDKVSGVFGNSPVIA